MRKECIVHDPSCIEALKKMRGVDACCEWNESL